MKRKHKQYFIYYLKDNILVFDVFDYVEEIAADFIDYCFEWGFIKENLVNSKNIRIKEYIQLYCFDAINEMTTISEKTNCKILCYFNQRKNLNAWVDYFQNPYNFINISKKVLSKKLPNFIETFENNLFEQISGKFNGIPCLIPSGEDEDFLLKNLKKLK